MKNIKTVALALGLLAGAGMMNSCSNDEYKFDEEYARKLAEAEFSANFVKEFGAIAPGQEWDFTAGSEYYLAGGATRATRAAGAYNPTVSDDYYNVESATLSWLNSKLKESTDNRSLGKPFAMSMPDNSFTIVPIYQGTAGMVWDLHMVVGTGEDAVDTKIWSKSEGIEVSKNGKDWNKIDQGGNTVGANNVRAKQFTFNDMPVGETIHFYLEITYGVDNWAKTGAKQSSLAGMMLALDCPRPTNIPSDKEVMIIGCEDSNQNRSDWDMNDIVFMVIGNPKVPKKIEIEDNTVIEKVEKRYMIEDLGVTDDFDFNDVVVDVKSERTVTYKIVNNVVDYSKTVYGEWKQKATIKHLGGQLPFTLKIGETTIADHPAGFADVNEEYEVKGWNAEANNISVTVRNSKSDAIYNIGFPEPGKAPLIIATDTKQTWMGEREKIDWLKDKMNAE